MLIKFGVRELEFPSEELGELSDATYLLDRPAALLNRLQNDGYILIRGFLPRDVVMTARGQLIEFLRQAGKVAEDEQSARMASTQLDSVFWGGDRTVTHHPNVRKMLEHPSLFLLFEEMFSERIISFDYKWTRALAMSKFTGIHYDSVAVGRGETGRRNTCWIPIGDVPVVEGPLAICEGSHSLSSFNPLLSTYGRMDVDRDHLPSWLSVDPLEITAQYGGRWLTTNFCAGDVLIFPMHTLHASLNNLSPNYRLSADPVFQPASDQVDDRWVGVSPPGHYAWQDDVSTMRLK